MRPSLDAAGQTGSGALNHRVREPSATLTRPSFPPFILSCTKVEGEEWQWNGGIVLHPDQLLSERDPSEGVWGESMENVDFFFFFQ